MDVSHIRCPTGHHLRCLQLNGLLSKYCFLASKVDFDICFIEYLTKKGNQSGMRFTIFKWLRRGYTGHKTKR
ncbi:unnamed protein product [Lactuca virosa]|uniref:Uncharacterized protein n=1 Tax=Lactuca virosa TaxID=75947 RepID=A0AAU9LZK9_9ASTR|nr:unnamed protein product [Lactuca virosa]